MGQQSVAMTQASTRQHAFGRLICSRSRAARLMRGAAIALGIALGLASLVAKLPERGISPRAP